MANFGIHRLQISDSDDSDRNILVRADRFASYESTERIDATTSWATASHADIPLDLTNSVETSHSGHTELSFPSGEIQGERLAKCWQSNYHEAAIFLRGIEGENNDKLDFHPCSREALPAYLVVHNVLFYCLDLLSATVLMALALMEAPAVPGLQCSCGSSRFR
ncbi:hypothetical protein MRX96_034076 [Rhipicephalus microplus]